MSHQGQIDRIYYQLLRERVEKIKEVYESFGTISGFDLNEATQISEDARTRYMIKAAAIFLLGELRK